jgi:GntR family transcriptional regulator
MTAVNLKQPRQISSRPMPSGGQSHSPIYMQLAQTLRQQIVEDKILSGEALPSERDLCALMGASRVTVRKAIELLIEEGLLSRRQGSGTYVTPRIQAQGSYLTSFSEDAAARGETTSIIWIERSEGSANAEEAQLLEIDEGVAVVRLSRVRMADGEPLAIENAVVPAEMLPAFDALGKSLYAALSERGNRPMRGEQKIRAALAGAYEAELLSIAEGKEILRIERLTRRSDGRPVELTRSAYRGERYEFVSALRGPFGAP